MSSNSCDCVCVSEKLKSILKSQSLSSCLPKDGVIHEVMSLSIETLALRCGQVYVVVDINDLTVIGQYTHTPHYRRSVSCRTC